MNHRPTAETSATSGAAHRAGPLSPAPRAGLLFGLARLAERRPWAVLLCFALSLLPTGYLAAQLKVDQDFGALLDPGHTAVQDLKAVADRIGGTAFAVVAIRVDDQLPRAKAFAAALSPRLEALPAVMFVDGHLDVDFLRSRRLLYLAPEQLEGLVDTVRSFIDARTAERSGLFVDLSDAQDAAGLQQQLQDQLGGETQLPVREHLIGEDGRYLYLFPRLAGSSGDLTFGRAAMKAIRAQVDALRAEPGFAQVQVDYSGSVLIRTEEDAVMSADLARSGLIGFFGILAVMMLYTRRLRSFPLVGLPLVISTVWTFAFARLAVGRLNIITGFLVAILLGLGVDFVIHLYLRFVELRRRGGTLEAATEDSLSSTGRAIISSALTTSAAFLVVCFADFVGYSEFGLIAGVGVLISAAVTLALFPALNTLLERRRAPRYRPHRGAGLVLPGWLRGLILVGVPLFFGFSVFQLARGEVRFHTNWRELKGESPAADFDDYIIDSLGRSNTMTLLAVPDGAALPGAEAAVRRVMQAREAAGQPAGIAEVISLQTLIPPDQAERMEEIQALAAQLARVQPAQLDPADRQTFQDLKALTQVKPFTAAEVPPSLLRRFQTADGQGSLVILVTDYLFYELDQMIDWADEMIALRVALDELSPKTHIMSENWVAGTVFKIVKGDGPFILWAAFVSVFFVLWVDFRRIRDALVVLASLVVGVVSIAGAMSLIGLQLNFLNAVIMPSLVGIGIDGAIHVYHRYLDEGAEAMPLVMRYTSAATLLAAATTMVGFGSLASAHHAGIRSIGQLALVGIVTTYVCTSVFFPLLLQRFGRSAPGGE